jgi:glycosyltransferase involved in cell wall biosynthesis
VSWWAWGRLVAEKLRSVRAARCCATATRIHFVVIGPDDRQVRRDHLVRARRGRRRGVRLLGSDDVEAWYPAMDLYLLASYAKVPRSAMEAAAMGLPIVATDVRGCRQVVVDGETGYLVPVRDAVAIAEAVRALAVDPARRVEMGRAARARARAEFDQERVIAITLATYERLLGTRPRSG